jgi:hypothetical protein
VPAPPYRIEANRLAGTRLLLAGEGPLTPGARHYNRVQGEDLLIEYEAEPGGVVTQGVDKGWARKCTWLRVTPVRGY